MNIGNLINMIANIIKSGFVGVIDIFNLIRIILRVNVHIFQTTGEVLLEIYRRIFDHWRSLLVATTILHVLAALIIVLGLSVNEGILVAIGGILLLAFYAITLGFVEGTAKIVSVMVAAAEENLNFYDKLIRATVPGGATGREQLEKNIFDFSKVEAAMAKIKTVRTLVIPFLVAVAFMVLVPAWWTAGLAVMVLFVSFLLAWYASTQGYDTSKAIRLTYGLVSWLIPAIIALAIINQVVPETGDGVTRIITDVRAWVKGDGLDNFDEELPIVYLTPIDTARILDDLAMPSEKILVPGDKFAIVGINESQFRLGELPNDQLIKAPNDVQYVIRIYLPNSGDVLQSYNETVLAEANRYQLFSNYIRPEPVKKGEVEAKPIVRMYTLKEGAFEVLNETKQSPPPRMQFYYSQKVMKENYGDNYASSVPLKDVPESINGSVVKLEMLGDGTITIKNLPHKDYEEGKLKIFQFGKEILN